MKHYNLKGQCNCGAVHYYLEEKPLFVHCCHCSYCQKETGSAFAINALIESRYIRLTAEEPVLTYFKTKSGHGQRIMRCPHCQIVLWSHYSSKKISFVRVGTLDQPELCPPDIHIYTSTKQPWLVLSDDKPIKSGYYSPTRYWPPESLKRYENLKQE